MTGFSAAIMYDSALTITGDVSVLSDDPAFNCGDNSAQLYFNGHMFTDFDFFAPNQTCPVQTNGFNYVFNAPFPPASEPSPNILLIIVAIICVIVVLLAIVGSFLGYRKFTANPVYAEISE